MTVIAPGTEFQAPKRRRGAKKRAPRSAGATVIPFPSPPLTAQDVLEVLDQNADYDAINAAGQAVVDLLTTADLKNGDKIILAAGLTATVMLGVPEKYRGPQLAAYFKLLRANLEEQGWVFTQNPDGKPAA